MKRQQKTLAMCGVMAAITLIFSTVVLADSIKSRMRDRLPVIVELKNRGIVGEDNQGYVRFVGERKEKVAVVDAENKDRKIVYRAIAQKTGARVDAVAKTQAQKWAERAKAGHWLQKADGSWYQKK